MERGVTNLHHPSSVADVEEVEAKFRHQSLLEDYVRLKKEVLSKKRRMRNWKKKRDVLKAEVRFLRKRYEDILQSGRMQNEIKIHVDAALERNPYETAHVSYHHPTMGNKLEEAERVGNQMSVERVPKKRKLNHNNGGNQTQSLIGRTLIKPVEKQRNQSQSNGALVSYPIMKRQTEESKRVEFEGGDQIGVEKLVVLNTGKLVKKKRVTWKDQVVPKV